MFSRTFSSVHAVLFFAIILAASVRCTEGIESPSPAALVDSTPRPLGEALRDRAAACAKTSDEFKERSGFRSGAEHICCMFGGISGLCDSTKWVDDKRVCATINGGSPSEMESGGRLWRCCVTKEGVGNVFKYNCRAEKKIDCSTECPSKACKMKTEDNLISATQYLFAGTTALTEECAPMSNTSGVTLGDRSAGGPTPSPNPSPTPNGGGGWLYCCGTKVPDFAWCSLYC